MPAAALMLLWLLAEMWVLAYRDGDHSQQTTTGAVEGLHSFYKREMNKRAPMLRGRGLAKVLGLFFEFMEPYFRMRAWGQLQGHSINTYRRDIVASALEAAKAMPASAVTVLDAAAGSCTVQNSSGVAGVYMVQSALGVNPSCTCPVGRGGMFCKHVAASMLTLGVPELTVRHVRGVLHGTNAGHNLASLSAQHAAAPSTPMPDSVSGCHAEAAMEAAEAAQFGPAHAATYSADGAGAAVSSGAADAACTEPTEAGCRTSVDQQAMFEAAVGDLRRAAAGCSKQSMRLEQLTKQLRVLVAHQMALNLRDGSGEPPQSQPLMPVTNAFNSSSVKRVPGALDGKSKRKAVTNAAQRRTAALPADAALLPATSSRKRKLTWQQELAADGGDVAAAAWLSQLPAEVKGSWVPEPHAGGELLNLVVD
jgi:hypothetical protein